MTSSSPPPIALLPGEVVIRHQLFTPRLFLVYLKTTVILTNRRLVVSAPNTIFGFIPHGFSVHSAPIENITDVACGNGRATSPLARLVGLAVVGMILFMLVMYMLRASGGF